MYLCKIKKNGTQTIKENFNNFACMAKQWLIVYCVCFQDSSKLC